MEPGRPSLCRHLRHSGARAQAIRETVRGPDELIFLADDFLEVCDDDPEPANPHHVAHFARADGGQKLIEIEVVLAGILNADAIAVDVDPNRAGGIGQRTGEAMDPSCRIRQ